MVRCRGTCPEVVIRSHRVNGTSRIHATLCSQEVRTSLRRVARLMLQLVLQGIYRPRRQGKPKRSEEIVVAPDQVR
ncbi:MAG: IS3 family transposase [Gammaproteobacteria bacterium]|nr:IS3 family transposase [Gammaproteobacteria bacterium]